jgi:hypothetical protein
MVWKVLNVNGLEMEMVIVLMKVIHVWIREPFRIAVIITTLIAMKVRCGLTLLIFGLGVYGGEKVVTVFAIFISVVITPFLMMLKCVKRMGRM